MAESPLIVGMGPGLFASFARLLSRHGYTVALAARRPDLASSLATELGSSSHRSDATDPAQVAALFGLVPEPEVVLYNPSFRVRGPLADLDPEAVRRNPLRGLHPQGVHVASVGVDGSCRTDESSARPWAEAF